MVGNKLQPGCVEFEYDKTFIKISCISTNRGEGVTNLHVLQPPREREPLALAFFPAGSLLSEDIVLCFAFFHYFASPSRWLQCPFKKLEKETLAARARRPRAIHFRYPSIV
jgi:hypothetical protein